MPSRAIPLSPAVSELLRTRRRELGYTLRAVEAMSAADGKPIPVSTLSRIERGQLDPGTVRLGQLMKIYGLPAAALGDVLELEDVASDPPAEDDPQALYDLGFDAMGAGDTRRALAAFLAFRRLRDRVDDRLLRQKGALALATTANTLGKCHFAKLVIEGLLLEGPDPEILVTVLVQVATCWNKLGCHEAALAFLDRAERHLRDDSPPHQRAFVHHGRASILMRIGEVEPADEAIERALEAYQDAKHEAGYCRALLTRVNGVMRSGDYAYALKAAEGLRYYARRHDVRRMALIGALKTAHARLMLGDYPRCLSILGKVVAEAIEMRDSVVRFYAHYYLWRVYEAQGDPERARLELDAASRFVEMVDEVTPETTEIRERNAARAENPKDRRR